MGFALVQSNKTTFSGNGDVRAYPGNVVANNLLVCIVSWYSATTTVSITDSQGNTWVSANGGPTRQSGRDNASQEIFYAIAGSSAACTLTFGASGSSLAFAAAKLEYSGNAIASVLDGHTEFNSTGLSTSMSVASANSLAIASATSGGVLTAGSAYTLGPALDPFWREGNEYNLDAGAAGSKTVDFGGGGDPSLIVAAAFKALVIATTAERSLPTLGPGIYPTYVGGGLFQ